MTHSRHLFAIVLLAVGQNVATGQAPKEIQDLFSDDVIAIAHIDVNKLNANSLHVFEPILAKIVDKETIEEISFKWRGLLQIGKDTMGIQEVYVGFILNDLHSAFGYVAVKLPAAGHPMLAQFGDGAGLNAERRDEWTILWKNQTKRRLAKYTTSSRGQALPQALEAVTQHELGLVYVPSQDIRRVFAELTPAELPYLGRGGGQFFSKVVWASFSVDVQNVAAAAKIRSENAKWAKGLASTLETAKTNFAADKEMERFVDSPAEVVSQLKFQQRGNDIDLKLTTDALGVLAANFKQHVERARDSQTQRAAANDLKQISLACHNHADQHGVLPADGYSLDGKPLLSWRVHILPFIDHAELYAKFHLDEPWDSPHNAKLIPEMPNVFLLASRQDIPAGKTVVQRPRGDGFMGQRGALRFRDITDGTSNTIMTLEAAKPVVWTQPSDWDFDAKNLAKTVGAATAEKFLIGRGDGSVQAVGRDVSAETFGKMLTISGGERVDIDD